MSIEITVPQYIELLNKLKITGTPKENKRKLRGRFDPCKMYVTLCKMNPNKNALKIDAQKIISLFLKRGANIDAIIQRTRNEDEKRRIEQLKSTYEIKSNVANGGHVVTIPRIAVCFPQMTITTLKNISDGKIHRPASFDTLRLFAPGYPKVLMTPIVSCVIPMGLKKTDKLLLFKAICLYCYIERVVLTMFNSTETQKEEVAKCWKYIELYHNYKLLEEDERVAFCKSEVMNEVFSINENGELSLKDAILNASESLLIQSI